MFLRVFYQESPLLFNWLHTLFASKHESPLFQTTPRISWTNDSSPAMEGSFYRSALANHYTEPDYTLFMIYFILTPKHILAIVYEQTFVITFLNTKFRSRFNEGFVVWVNFFKFSLLWTIKLFFAILVLFMIQALLCSYTTEYLWKF